MSYGAEVRRGPFGGDQFTILHNYVFRDPVLRGIDMGVLGHISTHRDRWGLSVKSIAAAMADGEHAVKESLKRLRAAHYVVLGQDQNDDGTFGSSYYFATDLPAQLKGAGVSDDAAIADAVQAAHDQWMKEQSEESAGRDR